MTVLELRDYLNRLPPETLAGNVKVLVPASDHSFRVADAAMTRVALYGRTEFSELPLVDGAGGIELDALVVS